MLEEGGAGSHFRGAKSYRKEKTGADMTGTYDRQYRLYLGVWQSDVVRLPRSIREAQARMSSTVDALGTEMRQEGLVTWARPLHGEVTRSAPETTPAVRVRPLLMTTTVRESTGATYRADAPRDILATEGLQIAVTSGVSMIIDSDERTRGVDREQVTPIRKSCIKEVCGER